MKIGVNIPNHTAKQKNYGVEFAVKIITKKNTEEHF